MSSLGKVQTARISILMLVGLVACALLATAAFGSVKVKTGAYVQAPAGKRAWGCVLTKGNKATGALLYTKLTDKFNMQCVPAGLYPGTNGLVEVSIKPKGKAAKVKSNDKFSFAAKGDSVAGLKGNVSGRFKSSNKATFKASVNIKGCKSPKLNFKKAIYSAGG